VPTF